MPYILIHSIIILVLVYCSNPTDALVSNRKHFASHYWVDAMPDVDLSIKYTNKVFLLGGRNQKACRNACLRRSDCAIFTFYTHAYKKASKRSKCYASSDVSKSKWKKHVPHTSTTVRTCKPVRKLDDSVIVAIPCAAVAVIVVAVCIVYRKRFKAGPIENCSCIVYCCSQLCPQCCHDYCSLACDATCAEFCSKVLDQCSLRCCCWRHNNRHEGGENQREGSPDVEPASSNHGNTAPEDPVLFPMTSRNHGHREANGVTEDPTDAHTSSCLTEARVPLITITSISTDSDLNVEVTETSHNTSQLLTPPTSPSGSDLRPLSAGLPSYEEHRRSSATSLSVPLSAGLPSYEEHRRSSATSLSVPLSVDHSLPSYHTAVRIMSTQPPPEQPPPFYEDLDDY